MVNNLKLSIFLLYCPAFVKLNDVEMLTGDMTENILDEKYKLTKKILVWNDYFPSMDFDFGYGNSVLKIRCEVSNCFITSNKRSLPLWQFDAVVFLGLGLCSKGKRLPNETRSPTQRYVYQSWESPATIPPSGIRDDYFNWTMTYRLDSDIPSPFFYVKDISGNTVAPSLNVEWIIPDYSEENLSHYLHIHKRKTKLVAWFASHCYTPSNRENIVGNLKKYISVDIYGACGSSEITCSRLDASCYNMLSEEYYFYLAFENGLSPDYVSEKVTIPLSNNAIPITYNGANMSRFLPPGSYIEANKLSAKQLAALMVRLARNPREYVKYFWWKKYYSVGYNYPNLCKLCELLHGPQMENKSYKIYKWLNVTE